MLSLWYRTGMGDAVSEKILVEMLYRWKARGVGNTHLILHGVLNCDCQVIVRDNAQATEFLRHGLEKKKIVYIEQLPHALLGSTKPLAIDHYPLAYLIRCALRESYNKGFEDGKKCRYPGE